MEEKFKISIVIISIILIAIWLFAMYWYIDNFYIKEFHWVILLSLPIAAFFSLVTVVAGVSGLISQYQVLRRKHK